MSDDRSKQLGEREAVVLYRDSINLIGALSRLESPREACGLVVWDKRVAVHRLTLAENVAEGDHNYSVDPEHHRRWFEDDSVEIDGVWHSHPRTEAELSRGDVAMGQPGMLYMIYSVVQDQCAAWRCVDEGDMLAFHPIDIQIL